MTMNKRFDTAPQQWEASVITCISDGRVHDTPFSKNIHKPRVRLENEANVGR